MLLGPAAPVSAAENLPREDYATQGARWALGGAMSEHCYYQGQRRTVPKDEGTRALKKLLNAHMATGQPKLPLSVDYGTPMVRVTKRFQRSMGISETGAICHKEAYLLLQRQFVSVAKASGVTWAHACQYMHLETNLDPGTVGWNGGFRDGLGLSQVVLRLHPTVTEAQAWDPFFTTDKFLAPRFKAGMVRYRTWNIPVDRKMRAATLTNFNRNEADAYARGTPSAWMRDIAVPYMTSTCKRMWPVRPF